MTKVRFWGVLALAVAGCSSSDLNLGLFEPEPVVAPLEPGGGFKAERVEGVTADLSMPDQVPASAALVQVEVSLKNTAGDVQVVSVPRPCDVFDWVIRDAAGKLVMTKDPVACPDQATSKAVAPGGSLNERTSVYLLPRVLHAGNRYSIEYRFWGQPAVVQFTAKR